MTIPNYQHFMLPVLKAAAKGIVYISDVVKEIADEIGYQDSISKELDEIVDQLSEILISLQSNHSDLLNKNYNVYEHSPARSYKKQGSTVTVSTLLFSLPGACRK